MKSHNWVREIACAFRATYLAIRFLALLCDLEHPTKILVLATRGHKILETFSVLGCPRYHNIISSVSQPSCEVSRESGHTDPIRDDEVPRVLTSSQCDHSNTMLFVHWPRGRKSGWEISDVHQNTRSWNPQSDGPVREGTTPGRYDRDPVQGILVNYSFSPAADSAVAASIPQEHLARAVRHDHAVCSCKSFSALCRSSTTNPFVLRSLACTFRLRKRFFQWNSAKAWLNTSVVWCSLAAATMLSVN